MSDTIKALLDEQRSFAPDSAFVEQANVVDESIYERVSQDPVGFWAGWAGSLEWFERWTTPLDWQPPYSKWFVGGKLNACHNCVDRHVHGNRSAKKAIV